MKIKATAVLLVQENQMLAPIKIGVSSCLLGNKVRYDGGHSHDRFLTQTRGLFAEYVPIK